MGARVHKLDVFVRDLRALFAFGRSTCMIYSLLAIRVLALWGSIGASTQNGRHEHSSAAISTFP